MFLIICSTLIGQAKSTFSEIISDLETVNMIDGGLCSLWRNRLLQYFPVLHVHFHYFITKACRLNIHLRLH